MTIKERENLIELLAYCFHYSDDLYVEAKTNHYKTCITSLGNVPSYQRATIIVNWLDKGITKPKSLFIKNV